MTSHDAIIIGGSYAGLSAATMLARARRRVLVVDAGEPRNRAAAHSHGVLAQDGRPGQEILAAAREQLAAYPTARFINSRVVVASGSDGDFHAETADGQRYHARKLLLAGGVSDRLPALPGLAEFWGDSVVHCPYCHGYETGGGPIGVLNATPMAAHHAALIADWGEVTLFTHDAEPPDAPQRAFLAGRGIVLETTRVSAAESSGGKFNGLRLADGRLVPLRAVFVASETAPRDGLAEILGCALESTPMGTRIIRTDANKQTTVAGIYAAGDAALARSNIMLAAADGVLAGVSLHQSLIVMPGQ